MNNQNTTKLKNSRRRGISLGGVLGIGGTIVFLALGGLLFAQRAADPPETGPMGGLVYEADLAAVGIAEAGGLVVEGAHIAMGQVPNDFTVIPEWTITNTSDQPITLGEPHASVLEGCCPGPLELGATTLAPGEATQLTFPLQMHSGMDGPHDFAIHVPIAGTDDYLTLGVTGVFG